MSRTSGGWVATQLLASASVDGGAEDGERILAPGRAPELVANIA